MNQPLRGQVEVVVPSSLSPSDAAAVLQKAVAARASVEQTDARSDRRLAGTLTDTTVALSVRDQRLWTRRKSWNVEFHGVFNPTSNGSTLHGFIEIPDRHPVHVLMWQFRIAGAMLAILSLAIAARDLIQGLPVSVWPVVVAVVVAAGLAVGTTLMEFDGERAAAADADLLVAFLKRTLT